jgi:hypothetical protein
MKQLNGGVLDWRVGMFSNASDPLLNLLRVIAGYCFGAGRPAQRRRDR